MSWLKEFNLKNTGWGKDQVIKFKNNYGDTAGTIIFAGVPKTAPKRLADYIYRHLCETIEYKVDTTMFSFQEWHGYRIISSDDIISPHVEVLVLCNPEQYLDSLKEEVEFLGAVKNKCPRAQLIIATNSPYIIAGSNDESIVFRVKEEESMYVIACDKTYINGAYDLEDISREVFGVPKRNFIYQDRLDVIHRLITDGDTDSAETLLRGFRKIAPYSADVTYAEMCLLKAKCRHAVGDDDDE